MKLKTILNWLKFVLLLSLLLIPVNGFSEEQEWWNDSWQYRKKITFDTTQTGADIKDNLAGVPVLLRLHTGNFDFTKALEDGSDIRFVKADGKTDIKHHIEYYDSIDEIALIWVNVPMISGTSNQDFIKMYYGNKNAMGGQDAGGTYDVNQVAVYHLNEIEGNPADSTAYKNNVVTFMGTPGLPAIIGNGLSLNGVDNKLIIPSSPSLNFKDGITFSSWIKILDPQIDSVVFSMKGSDQIFELRVDGSKLYAVLKEGDNVTATTEKNVDLSVNTWHHIAVTAAPRQRMSIYLNSIDMTWINIDSFNFEKVTSLSIGSDVNSMNFFSGDIDEISISNIVRPEAWIRLISLSQGSESLLTGFGEEEIMEGGGDHGLYLATIIKNITLDTIIIIAILTIFGMMSWMIMISKGYTYWQMDSDNKKFLEAFNNSPNLMGLDIEDPDYTSSPLYRMYAQGRKIVTAIFDKAESHSGSENQGRKKLDEKLSRGTIEKIKGALERSYMEENHGLNSWIVFLTICIAGGPFLGLLGTVWGVMNVFASLAEAGEASIMAVAPGVSSALAATVFGLIVAIPALFGYNYLTGRIKRLTGSMNLFIDEFIIKLEHGEDE